MQGLFKVLKISRKALPRPLLQLVLPQAAAQLALAFAEEGVVDYVQGNIAALAALGTPTEPTDLLLRVDARIDHLLLDEFQDTSFTQLDLLERLTAGWQGDGQRTIFAVGDPMQSIYRFREAEVRLFVEAQESGRVAGLAVERLTLRKNFRAQANLVALIALGAAGAAVYGVALVGVLYLAGIDIARLRGRR